MYVQKKGKHIKNEIIYCFPSVYKNKNAIFAPPPKRGSSIVAFQASKWWRRIVLHSKSNDELKSPHYPVFVFMLPYGSNNLSFAYSMQ